MSITVSLVVVLLLLSLHACNARIFGVVYSDHSAKEFQYSTNKESSQKLNPGSIDRKKSGEAEKGKNKKSEAGKYKYRESGMRKKKKIKGEQEAGFSLDYLPPRTHPPVHN